MLRSSIAKSSFLQTARILGLASVTSAQGSGRRFSSAAFIPFIPMHAHCKAQPACHGSKAGSTSAPHGHKHLHQPSSSTTAAVSTAGISMGSTWAGGRAFRQGLAAALVACQSCAAGHATSTVPCAPCTRPMRPMRPGGGPCAPATPPGPRRATVATQAAHSPCSWPSSLNSNLDSNSSSWGRPAGSARCQTEISATPSSAPSALAPARSSWPASGGSSRRYTPSPSPSPFASSPLSPSPSLLSRSPSFSSSAARAAAPGGPSLSGTAASPSAQGDQPRPDRWRKTYRLEADGERNRCTVRAEGHEIHSDVPLYMGGTDTAPQPVILLLSALVGCETATAHFVARHMRLRVRNIHFTIEGWRDQRGTLHMPVDAEPGDAPAPAMLQEVRGTAVVDTDATQEEVDALAHQVHWRCPVANMIEASGCKLDIKWIKSATSDS